MPIMPKNIPEDSTSFFDSALPSVVVEKITLDVGGDSENTVHYYADTKGKATHARTENERIRKLFVNDPHLEPTIDVNFNPFANDWMVTPEPTPEHLNADLSLRIKLSIPKGKDAISSYLFNDQFVKYFKVFVVQNTDLGAYQNAVTLNENRATLMLPSEIEGILNDIEEVASSPNVRTFTGTNLIEESGIVGAGGIGSLFYGAQADEFLIKLNKTIDGNGNTIVDIPFHINKFVVNEIEPEHLSYLLISTVDINQIKTDFPELDDVKASDFGLTVNPVLVIANKKVSGVTKLFTYAPGAVRSSWGGVKPITQLLPGEMHEDLSGQSYWGPVHTHGNGRYMSGAHHTKDSVHLDVKLINNKLTGLVQDFRVFPQTTQQLKHMDAQAVSAVPSRNLKLLTNDQLNIDKKNTYFSNLFSSRDLDWHWADSEKTYKERNRFFFSVNFYEMIKQNVSLNFFQLMGLDSRDLSSIINDPNDRVAELIQQADILSFKLWRKRVDLKSGINDKGLTPSSGIKDFEKNQVPILVASWNPIQNGANAKESGRIRKIDRRFLTSHDAGSVVDMSHNEPYMLHFSGDEEIKPSQFEVEQKSKTNTTEKSLIRSFNDETGFWSYYVEMEVRDPTTSYFSNIYNSFQDDVLIPLEEYYAMASAMRSNGLPYYNARKQQFHTDLVSDLQGHPGNIDDYGQPVYEFIQGIITSPRFNNLYKYILFSLRLRNTISPTYHDGLLFSEESVPSVTDKEARDLTEAYSNMLNPNIATLEGIKMVLDTVRTSMKNFEVLLTSINGGVVKKEPIGEDTGTLPIRHNINVERTFKIEYHFDGEEDIVNFGLTPRAAVDYLNIGPPELRNLQKFAVTPPDFTGLPSTSPNQPQQIAIHSTAGGLSIVSPSWYKSRCSKEMEKYFSPNTNFVNATTRPVLGTLNKVPLDIDETRFSYLTVSTIHYKSDPTGSPSDNSTVNGNGNYYFLAPNAVSPKNWKFYYNLFLKFLRFNAGLANGQDPYNVNYANKFTKILSPDQQIFRNEIIDFLSSKSNCTVQNIEAFQAKDNHSIRLPKAWDPNAYPEIDEMAYASLADKALETIYEDKKPKFAWDEKNVTAELSQLLSYYIEHTKANSFGAFNAKDYDINNPNGPVASAAVDFYTGTGPVLDLPPQIKALISLMTNLSTRQIVMDQILHGLTTEAEMANIEDDVIIDLQSFMGSYDMFSKSEFKLALDRVLFPFFYFYFLGLKQMQALQHYQVTDDKVLMKVPVYAPITKNLLNIPQNSSFSICRHVNYNNELLNIFDFENIDLPIYNEYFMLADTFTVGD